MIERVEAERARSPNAWEMGLYRESASRAERAMWSRIFDEAHALRWDDAALRAGESLGRRQAERAWCGPAPAVAAAGPRSNVFRSLYRRSGSLSDFWCDCDYVALDSGKLYGWIDYIDAAHYIYQPTPANAVATPTADALMANAKTANFSATHFYDTTRLPADFSSLVSGSGVDLTAAFVPTALPGFAVVWANVIGVQPGSQFYIAANGSGNYQVDTTGGSLAVTNSVAAMFAIGTPTYVTTRFKSTESPIMDLLKKNVRLASTSPAGTPASPPAYAFRIGAQHSAGFPLRARVRGFYYFHRLLNAAETQIRNQWIRRDTGIAPTA